MRFQLYNNNFKNTLLSRVVQVHQTQFPFLSHQKAKSHTESEMESAKTVAYRRASLCHRLDLKLNRAAAATTTTEVV